MADEIRVLLVDDQELFRTAIAIMVNAQPDMTVVGQAGNGLEAVELVNKLHPDVVVMDIRMPDMDGVAATQQIMAGNDPIPKILILTTFDLDDRAATAIRCGASGFLLKDASPAQLRDAIHTVYAGDAVLSPNDLGTLLAGQFANQRQVPQVVNQLTEREREVLDLVAKGLSNSEIAETIFASESTVKAHVGAILRKLGLRDRVQIVVFAYQNGLVA